MLSRKGVLLIVSGSLIVLLGAVASVLIAQEEARLGEPPGLPSEILTHWLLRLPLWTSLSGFLMVLWGSFLLQKPTDSALREKRLVDS